jgi:cell division transport system permease protein
MPQRGGKNKTFTIETLAGIRRRKSPRHDVVTAYALEHVRNLIFSLGRLYRSPLSSTMTTAVIAIALALPSGLYVLLKNVQAVSDGWQNTGQISLFLKLSIDVDQMQKLAAQLATRPEIVSIDTVQAEQALSEFRNSSGFGKALEALDENPLPHVIIVTPKPDYQPSKNLEKLANELANLPEVDLAQLDLQWLQRLHALIDIAQRTIIAIAGTLAVAVLLIIGNTIRLDIQSRRNEIEVVRLVGGTDAFIRRPFLYGGLWYGVIGGIMAWTMVYAAVAMVEAPTRRLASLYDSHYQIVGLGTWDSLTMLLVSAGLGLAGSWLAVGRHLGEIDSGEA